ncbi:Uncharacterised protein [Alcaligenes faecalis subsp. faecalis]|nr:Uncharacterised protein [Alcaligenes faecalis subsp. faecalis]
MLIIIAEYFWAFSTGRTPPNRSSPSTHHNNSANHKPWPHQAPNPKTLDSPPSALQPALPSAPNRFFIFLRCEPLGGRVQGGGRFRLLAAGGSDIRDASPVLFEPDACTWSGGPSTWRVHRAPGYQNRQGYRCAASASSQARPPGPGPQAASPQKHQTKKTDISNPGVGRDIGSKAGGLFPACYRFKTCF